MSERQETTPLKSRAEKVRAFLRSPVVDIGLFVSGLSGTLATVFGTSELAERLIDAGNPYASLVAGGAGALGMGASYTLVRASDAMKEIFSEDAATSKKAKRDFMRSVPRSAAIGGAVLGGMFGAAAFLTQVTAQTEKTEEARIVTLPALDPNTVLPAKTAAQEFCKARDGGRTIVVETVGPNGKPTEFRLACPK